jgi:glycosyltransferase involved in cell wall biosynthesis
VVTHDDMTVAQAVDHGYPQWRALPAAAVERRLRIQREAYERATACCVTSRWAAASVIHDYGIAADKVHVVGVGRNYGPRARDRDWAVPRFLFVGKDWERKNGPAVLRAFARLRGEVPRARLDVVGGHPPLDAPGVVAHGPLHVDRPEDRARLDELFGRATCFVMPSWHEPFGIVFSEAGAAGIPSIGTTEGGCGELIEGAGRVVHPADDEALLAALRDLSDPQLARRLGAVAGERAELFTWRAVGERMLRALGVVADRPLAEFL